MLACACGVKHMKYSGIANIINILFLLALVGLPASYCLYYTDISYEYGRGVIMLSAVLAIFVLTDWYHLYISNSYKGVLGGVALGVSIAVLSLAIASMLISVPAIELALLNDNGAWSEARFLFKGYVVGAGIMAAALFSIPRLWLIRLFSNSELPHA